LEWKRRTGEEPVKREYEKLLGELRHGFKP
jgi:hypothetical protein